MSGFAAFAGPSSAGDGKRWAREAAAYLAFAGPDGQSAWSDGCAALAHAWLRTSSDEAPRTMPLTLDGRTWLTGDIRLDARAELARTLRARGRGVAARASDAELLLHAYDAWGESCVEHIAGDFAFALWDARRARLLCARDQFGIAPLFHARLGDRLLVANAVDALLLHPELSDALDEGAVADLLVHGMTMDASATTFARVRRLPPAHLLTWADGRVTVRRYWRLRESEPLAPHARAGEYVEQFRALLGDAVSDRMRTDRVSVQLSGGLDSTSIAVLAHRRLADRGGPFELRAHTLVMDGLMPDEEGRYASLVADSLGIACDAIAGADFADRDPLAPPELLSPEPTHYRQTAFEEEFVRRPAAHGPVVLSGLGGDPLLCFDPSYWMQWLARGDVARLGGVAWRHVRQFGRLPRPHLRAALRMRTYLSTPARIPDWLEPSLAERVDAHARAAALAASARHLLDVRGMAESPYWSGLLGRGHAGFTRLPVSFRYPFFDLRLVRFARSLPPVPWLVRKTILREAMRDLLPEAVRDRPKTPLARAPSQAFAERRDARAGLRALVDATPALDQFVDRARMRAALDSMADVALASHRTIAASLGLAYWLQHWRRPVRPVPLPVSTPASRSVLDEVAS